MFKGWSFAALALTALLGAGYAEKTEHFDRDPRWDAHNNRPTSPPREIKQDFGYSRTDHCGRGAGEIGGFIQPSAEPAYYASPIERKTLADPLTASGVLNIPDGAAHVLLGFFNRGTLKEWRTPNTIAIRLSGRGDHFLAWLEYATSKWRAGGDSPKGFARVDPETGRGAQLKFPAGKRSYPWTLRYDPAGNGGAGSITATIGDETAICNLEPGHRMDGATFDRFGLMNLVKHADSGGNVWLDDIEVLGRKESFALDPRWEALNTRRTYQTFDIRPRFDFGYSATQFAGGERPGELGGMLYRGDGRYPEKMAFYGDPLPAPLDMKRPLRIRGKVAMRRGVTDSTVLLGFFNRQKSPAINPSQDTGLPYDFFGVAIEGPSSEGFLVYPCYRVPDGSRAEPRLFLENRIYPDGRSHTFSMDYDPQQGRVTVRLDGGSGSFEVPAADREAGVTFDRFGIVTTRIDGNGQHVYWDDLTYTVRQ